MSETIPKNQNSEKDKRRNFVGLLFVLIIFYPSAAWAASRLGDRFEFASLFVYALAIAALSVYTLRTGFGHLLHSRVSKRPRWCRR